jgi:hypothetical protein
LETTNVNQVVSCFPKLTSLFISPQCGDDNIYDDFTFEHLTNLTDFRWPSRPNLERIIHQQISHRVFAAGYAKRLCGGDSGVSGVSCDQTSISNLFFGQPLFDIRLLKLIFDHAA